MVNSHEKDKFVIRLPDGLRPAINAKAKANLRSMNNEIIHRIERSLELELLYADQVKLNAFLVQCIENQQNPIINVEPFAINFPNKGEG